MYSERQGSSINGILSCIGLVQYRAEFNFSKEFIDNYVIGDKTLHSVLQREVNSNDDTYKVTEQYLSKIETIVS